MFGLQLPLTRKLWVTLFETLQIKWEVKYFIKKYSCDFIIVRLSNYCVVRMLHEHVYVYISIFIMWVYNTMIGREATEWVFRSAKHSSHNNLTCSGNKKNKSLSQLLTLTEISHLVLNVLILSLFCARISQIMIMFRSLIIWICVYQRPWENILSQLCKFFFILVQKDNNYLP